MPEPAVGVTMLASADSNSSETGFYSSFIPARYLASFFLDFMS